MEIKGLKYNMGDNQIQSIEPIKEFKKDLILKKDTIFKESIKVDGNIRGDFFNLKVEGNINAGDINARDIDARDIDAGNINAGDINAGNINAGDINAWDIICEKRIKKDAKNKTICRVYVKNRSKKLLKEIIRDNKISLKVVDKIFGDELNGKGI